MLHSRVMFMFADKINPDVVVNVGEKLNLRCPQNSSNANVETITWYKDNETLRQPSARMRMMKQSLRFRYVDLNDAGVYGCKLNSNATVEWRNVTVHVETVQNDGFQDEEGDETSDGVMDTLRPEDESNDLEMKSKSSLTNFSIIRRDVFERFRHVESNLSSWRITLTRDLQICLRRGRCT